MILGVQRWDSFGQRESISFITLLEKPKNGTQELELLLWNPQEGPTEFLCSPCKCVPLS